MNKFITLIVILTLKFATALAQCVSLYSHSDLFETVTFSNLSTVSNPHYFWNFGDGTGSNLQNPIHKFPETGNYLVTLFIKDNISGCSSYYENWIPLTKYSTDTCQPSITDSVFANGGNNFLKIIDQSTKCGGYPWSDCDGGPAGNSGFNSWILLPTFPFHMVCRSQYYDTSMILKREAYKSSLHLYLSANNYGDCSANFEFTVVSSNISGQRILFKAMNSTATIYDWNISGFGNPIHSSNDTISQFYPYNINDLWSVGLAIKGSTGCLDTLWQNILARDSAMALTDVNVIQKETSISIYPNPANGSFIVKTNTTDKQTLDLYDVNGRHVFNASVIGTADINVNSLDNGIYTLTIKNSLSIANKKLVIAR